MDILTQFFSGYFVFLLKMSKVSNNSEILEFGLKEWFYGSEEDCLTALGDRAYPTSPDGVYCSSIWDKVLCWPATPAGRKIRQHCPPLKALDPRKYAYRTCGNGGVWEGESSKVLEEDVAKGWTNYTGCYTEQGIIIYNKIFGKADSEMLKQIARAGKLLEFAGLTISLLSLVISIIIFCHFRSLRCHRTKIHGNLFVAISIHIFIQLVVSTDELVALLTGSEIAGTMMNQNGMINNTPIMCVLLRRVVLEYTKTVMFMWMFIEGLYLHNTLVISVFSGRPNYLLYYAIGWGFPVLLTLVWSVLTGLFDKEDCWFGYTFRALYWIIEGPRAAIILVNLGFLLNIIRVLVTKLRDSNSNEALRVRKAVKAAIVLLPLLGVNNSLSLVEPPMDDAILYGTFQILFVFLVSFQGFFIALIYCFLNGEVKQTLSKHWDRYRMKKHYTPGHSRNSRTESIFYSVTDTLSNKIEKSPVLTSQGQNKRESADSGYHGQIKPESVNLMNGHSDKTGLNGTADNHLDDCSL